jgi:hypothetical protein
MTGLKLTPKLNLQQKKYAKAIRWLLDDAETPSSRGNRCSGRSTLMAHIFIQMAYDRPGHKVYLFDHCAGFTSTTLKRYTVERVKKIIADSKLTGFTVRAGEASICYAEKTK